MFAVARSRASPSASLPGDTAQPASEIPGGPGVTVTPGGGDTRPWWLPPSPPPKPRPAPRTHGCPTAHAQSAHSLLPQGTHARDRGGGPTPCQHPTCPRSLRPQVGPAGRCCSVSTAAPGLRRLRGRRSLDVPFLRFLPTRSPSSLSVCVAAWRLPRGGPATRRRQLLCGAGRPGGVPVGALEPGPGRTSCARGRVDSSWTCWGVGIWRFSCQAVSDLGVPVCAPPGSAPAPGTP